MGIFNRIEAVVQHSGGWPCLISRVTVIGPAPKKRIACLLNPQTETKCLSAHGFFYHVRTFLRKGCFHYNQGQSFSTCTRPPAALLTTHPFPSVLLIHINSLSRNVLGNNFLMP
jgi:hypothetical protein